MICVGSKSSDCSGDLVIDFFGDPVIVDFFGDPVIVDFFGNLFIVDFFGDLEIDFSGDKDKPNIILRRLYLLFLGGDRFFRFCKISL
jgi:hypothetical protein